LALGDTTVSSSPPVVERQRVRQLRLVFGPNDKRPTVVLHGEALVIGRRGHVEGPLALDDHEVSRRHAVVEPDAGGGWALVDQESKNGVFVDGARVEGRRALTHGSVVRVGRTLLVYLDVELTRGELLVSESARLVGTSLAIQRLRAAIARAARRDAPVLILGETGVGKELVAAELHAHSGRGGRFVAVNCAAIPANLAESELFGHAAGSFTGARGRAEGLVSAAQGGTLFLDEIGEMSAELQPKLLRALANHEVRAVGSTEATRIDVRFVAATHVDLEAAAQRKAFREDLYARLAGVVVQVPPLRERRDDIVQLAELFLRAHSPVALSADAAESLLVHAWPRNVRELEQVMAGVAAQAEGADEVTLAHLPAALAEGLGARAQAVAASPSGEPIEAPDDAQAPSKEELEALLQRFGGNVARVAHFLHKGRQQVYRWAKRHGIDLAGYR
jgi:DNA-binding NtrC family response regulator